MLLATGVTCKECDCIHAEGLEKDVFFDFLGDYFECKQCKSRVYVIVDARDEAHDIEIALRKELENKEYK